MSVYVILVIQKICLSYRVETDGAVIFRMCDGDGDGSVSHAEFRGCADGAGGDVTAFCRLDSDGKW